MMSTPLGRNKLSIMASYFKKNGKWHVRFYMDGKQRRLHGFESKREAIKAVEEVLNENELRKESPKAVYTFDYVTDEYLKDLERRCKPQTSHNAKLSINKNIRPYFKNFDVCDIRKPDIIDWYDSLQWSDKHKHDLMKRFRAIMRFASVNFNVKTIDTSGIRFVSKDLPKERTIWNPEEFNRFIIHTEGKYHALFNLLFFSGLRIGEALALTDADLDGNVVSVTKTVNRSTDEYGTTISSPKTRSSVRKVTIPEEIADELRSLAKTPGYIFSAHDKCEKPMSSHTVNKYFRTTIEKAGVPMIHVHDLRHSHASYLLSSGVPITAISKRLGHSSITITMNVYSHQMKRDEDKVMDALLNVLSHF